MVFFKGGTQNLKVVFSYKDENDNIYIKEDEEQKVYVISKLASETEYVSGEEEWSFVSIANKILVVAIAIISIVIIVNILIKKKEVTKK